MKNLKLLYFINVSYFSWFWLGTWILYYRSFGGFSAVGILETVMIVSTILFEIPTGAIGDLLGKRATLIIAYLLSGISNIWMGFAPSLLHMIFSLILMNFGGALRSGTFEAMIYDTLKDEGKESAYNRIISKMTATRLLMLALSASVGGYMYLYWHGLPYVLCGISLLIGGILSFYLVEPKIDTEKFTVKNYLKQNVLGFKQLFINNTVMKKTLAVTSVMVISLILYEGVNDILGVSFGFSEVQLGYLAAILSLVAAGASILGSKLESKLPGKILYLTSIPLYSLSLLASPFVGLYLGGLTLLIRNVIAPILENEASTVINQFVESKYRATALSSFSMLKSLPYALTIYVISAATDHYPVQKIAFILGLFMIVAGIVNWKVFGVKKVSVQD